MIHGAGAGGPAKRNPLRGGLTGQTGHRWRCRPFDAGCHGEFGGLHGGISERVDGDDLVEVRGVRRQSIIPVAARAQDVLVELDRRVDRVAPVDVVSHDIWVGLVPRDGSVVDADLGRQVGRQVRRRCVCVVDGKTVDVQVGVIAACVSDPGPFETQCMKGRRKSPAAVEHILPAAHFSVLADHHDWLVVQVGPRHAIVCAHVADGVYARSIEREGHAVADYVRVSKRAVTPRTIAQGIPDAVKRDNVAVLFDPGRLRGGIADDFEGIGPDASITSGRLLCAFDCDGQGVDPVGKCQVLEHCLLIKVLTGGVEVHGCAHHSVESDVRLSAELCPGSQPADACAREGKRQGIACGLAVRVACAVRISVVLIDPGSGVCDSPPGLLPPSGPCGCKDCDHVRGRRLVALLVYRPYVVVVGLAVDHKGMVENRLVAVGVALRLEANLGERARRRGPTIDSEALHIGFGADRPLHRYTRGRRRRPDYGRRCGAQGCADPGRGR